MQKNFRRSFALLAVAGAAAGSLLVGLAGTASAAGSPPWEPVGSPDVGGLTFYNAAGQQITGGNLTDAPLAAYIEGSTVLRAGDTSATLYGATPVYPNPAGQWSGEQLSGSTTYPNASAPAPLKTSSLPVVTGSPSDESLATYIGDFPNNDTSPTDGYAGIYVLRLFTGSSGNPTTSTYDAADIQVTGSTWSVVYPTPSLTSTTTTVTGPTGPLTASNASGAPGQTLTATVNPAVAGTVQFTVNGIDVGSPVSETTGTASLPGQTLPVGSDSVGAVFSPATFLAYSGSTATPGSVLVNPAPAANTDTALGVPSTGSTVGTTPLTATVTNAGTSAALLATDGSVTFYDNGTTTSGTISESSVNLGVAALGTGSAANVAVLNASFGTAGTHNIVAQFTPSNLNNYNPSTSSNEAISVSAPTVPPVSGTVEASIPNTGTLTISTPYSSTNPFNLGTASLDTTDSFYTATGTFGSSETSPTNAEDPFTVTDTRAGDLGWTASATVTDFQSGSNTINGENLTFTNLAAVFPSGNALAGPGGTGSNGSWVTLTSVGPNSTVYSASDGGSNGLKGGPHPVASAPSGNSIGSVSIDGTLTLKAPTSTPSGDYAATLTFTVA
jgi:hypothetical protein